MIRGVPFQVQCPSPWEGTGAALPPVVAVHWFTARGRREARREALSLDGYRHGNIYGLPGEVSPDKHTVTKKASVYCNIVPADSKMVAKQHRLLCFESVGTIMSTIIFYAFKGVC